MAKIKISVLLLITVCGRVQTAEANNILCRKNQSVLLSNLTFTLYNKQNQQDGILLTEQTLNQVDPNLRVIFIIHGWLQKATKAWVLLMKDTYLNKTDDANIISLDWSHYSGINFREAYCSVPEVGNFVGDLIYNLTETPGIDLTTVQLNGFSLGGHVSGYAGQRVQNLTDSIVGRIIGLDVAAEGYVNVSTDRRLDATDATFVQAIHTNNYQFGYPYEYGTVDFEISDYVVTRCGSNQNGCPLTPGFPTGRSPLPYFLCDHVRAIAYFIESINSDDFLGVECDTCNNFGLRLCSSNPTTIMGENCPSTATGLKFLHTNSEPPFALGLAGT